MNRNISRSELAIREVLTWAPIWGWEWAAEYLRLAAMADARQRATVGLGSSDRYTVRKP